MFKKELIEGTLVTTLTFTLLPLGSTDRQTYMPNTINETEIDANGFQWRPYEEIQFYPRRGEVKNVKYSKNSVRLS